MLPSPIFNTYTQYKSDTLKIATWLGSTARKCGYTRAPIPTAPNVPDNSILNPEGKAVKLKGRARKLAKEAAAREAKEAKDGGAGKQDDDGAVAGEGSKGDGVKSSEKYIIQLREFVPMAEAIARTVSRSPAFYHDGVSEIRQDEAGVKISTSLIKLFRRCIRTRTGVKEWYDTVPDADDGGGHCHFIEVLQKALQVLVPVHELQALEARNFRLCKLRDDAGADGQERNGEKDENAGKRGNTVKVTNAYGQLEIEELDEETLDALPSANPTTTKEPSDSEDNARAVTYEVEDDGEDWLFALHCLWGDIHQIQHYLKGLWLIYAEGEADLATVAVVTNTAIELVRRAEEDFHNAGLKMPEPFTMPHMDQHLCNLYFIELCIQEGIGPVRESRECMVPLEAWDQVEESFLHVYKLLRTPRNSRMAPIPITRPAWLGTYDPKLDRNTASEKRLFEQDAGLLMDMIVTIGPFARLGNTPMDDALMEGVRDHLTESPPLWFVFAAQISLDIHQMLKTKGEQPFEDLHQFALGARRTLRGHVKFSEKHDLTGFRDASGEQRVLETMKEIDEWALNDKILDIFNEQMSVRKQVQSNKRSGSKKVRVWKENEILKMHPLLCGMWKYCFSLQMQLQGIRLVNETMIMSAAHLYNALRQNGYLAEDCFWVDAEYLLDIHADANTFLGDRPDSMEECTKRLAIAQGVSAQTFASGRRTGAGQHRVIFSKTGGKFLSQCTPVAGVLTPRFLENKSVDLSLGGIEAILGRRIDIRKKALARLEKLGIDKKSLEGINTLREYLSMGPLTQEEWENKQKYRDEPLSDSCEDDEGPSDQDGDIVMKPEKALGCPCGKEHDTMDWEEAEIETLDRWEKEHKLSLCDFLSELSASLEEEELDIEFDYFAFHRSTWRLLESIHQACLPLVRSSFEEHISEILATDEGVTVMPGLLMLMASDATKCPNLVALKNGVEVDDQGLVTAAELMKEFIEREGASLFRSEKQRLIRRRNNGWSPGNAIGPEEGSFSAGVGGIANMTVEESAQILQGMTLEDAWARADQQKAGETREEGGEKTPKSKKRKKKAKKSKVLESDGGVEKEKMQPQVADDSDVVE